MGSIHEKNQWPKISCYCTFNKIVKNTLPTHLEKENNQSLESHFSPETLPLLLKPSRSLRGLLPASFWKASSSKSS